MEESDIKDYFCTNIITYLNDLLDKEKNSDGFLLNKNRIEETLYIFRELFYDKDLRYFNKFYDSFMKIYYSDRTCSYRNSIFSNRLFNSYFINLYLVMKGYKSHRENDDFDSFSVIVDDINFIDIDDYYLDSSSFDCVKKELYLSLIEKLITSNNYKLMTNTQNLVKRLITFDELDECLSNVGTIMKLCMSNSFDREVLEALLDKDKFYYYSDLINEKELFFYLNNKLYKSIENDRIRKDVFLIISDFNKGTFNNSIDNFIKSMDIVFDSDSYIELLNKLLLLKNINPTNDFNDTLDELKKLKDTYNGKEVTFPLELSFINMIRKPTSIFSRMKKSYHKINNDISLELMEDIYNNSTDLFSFVNLINLTFKAKDSEEINVQKKVKEKRFSSMFRRLK